MSLVIVQSYVNVLDGVLAVPPGAVAQALPTAGTGPNGGVTIETFNMTAAVPSNPPTMAVQTAG